MSAHMDDPSRALALLASLEANLRELNAEVEALPMWEKAKAGLHERYGAFAIGSPRIGNGTKEIFGRNTPDAERVRALRDDSLVHREEYRRMMRKKGMPEPMIWNFYPALTPDERDDERVRVQRWNEKSSRIPNAPKGEVKTPFEVFQRRELQKLARLRGIPFELVERDQPSRDLVKKQWDDLEKLSTFLGIVK